MTFAVSVNERSEWERARAHQQRGKFGVPADPSFRANAAEAQRITEPFWLLSGPAETGKTYAALWRLDSEARKYKNSQWLLARKIRTTMDSTVLKTWKRIIAVRGGVTVFGGEHPQWYDYEESGARVWVVGFDNPAKILSGEFDGACINQAEELDEADAETLTTRTTGRGAVTQTPMVWGDCNPGPEDHWIMRRKASGGLTLLESHHEDNPTLHDGATWTDQGVRSLATLDKLTGVRYQRLRLGRWVGAEGQFFTEWDEKRHIKHLSERPRDWRIWGSLDYGFAHPLAFGLFCADGEGNIHQFAEHARSRWLIPQHARAIIDLCAAHRIDPTRLRIVAGHDAWATRGGDDTETIADKFAKYGLIFERATIDRVNGAQALLTRLGNAEAGLSPTLFVDPSCVQTIATMPRMVTDPRNPEDVLKVDADSEGRGGDDCYDMLRYGVMAYPAIDTGFSHSYDDRTKKRHR